MFCCSNNSEFSFSEQMKFVDNSSILVIMSGISANLLISLVLDRGCNLNAILIALFWIIWSFLIAWSLAESINIVPYSNTGLIYVLYSLMRVCGLQPHVVPLKIFNRFRRIRPLFAISSMWALKLKFSSSVTARSLVLSVFINFSPDLCLDFFVLFVWLVVIVFFRVQFYPPFGAPYF